MSLMSAQSVAPLISQAILARQRVRERFGLRHGIIEMFFAPAAIAGSSFSLVASAPAWLLTGVTAALSVALSTTSVELIQPVPPGEPAKPRLTHVCLTSHLLPIPRAAWR
jgi:hypothetical protein